MAFFHGARAEIKVANTFKVNAAASGIPVFVGTAPVQMVGNTYAPIVLAENFEEAKAALGYSDNWAKYTLCEAMYTMFKLYGVGPALFINVLDVTAAGNKTEVTETSMTMADGMVELPEDAIASTVTVKNNTTTLVAGTDYTVYYEDEKCIVAAIPGGAMASLTSVTIGYSKVSCTIAGTKSAVIGGYNADTGVSTGLELVDECYAKYQVNPDLIVAPGYSTDKDVAAAMQAKTTINTVFKAMAIIDLDTSTAATYTAAATLKDTNGYSEPTEVLCWPKVKDADHTYFMSTHLAALMCKVDSENDDCPSNSPSNHTMQISAMVLANGNEVAINLPRANYLNSVGIVTALNFVGAYKAWGNYTAAYPSSTFSVEYFIPVRRMFNWVCNSLVITYWPFVDSKLNRRLCETIADSATVWLNGLTAAGHMYGGRVEFEKADNPDEDIIAGIIRPHVYMAPTGPAQEIDFLVEYDASYVSEALGIE